MDKQVGFYINVATCIGCKTCVVACKDKMTLKSGNFRRVYDIEVGSIHVLGLGICLLPVTIVMIRNV